MAPKMGAGGGRGQHEIEWLSSSPSHGPGPDIEPATGGLDFESCQWTQNSGVLIWGGLELADASSHVVRLEDLEQRQIDWLLS